MASQKTVVLITGANSGIGYDTSIALATASADYHVVMACRNQQKGEKALAEVKARNPKSEVSLVQLDVTDEASIDAAAKAVEKSLGRVDVLVNNAGITALYGPRIKALQDTFATNTIGPYLVTEAFLPLLKKSQNARRLIYVSSDLGSIGLRLDPTYRYRMVPVTDYRMSKAALNMLAVCHQYELSDDGFKVFAFNPGYAVTNLTGEADRDNRVKQGACSSELSAADLVKIIDGSRDSDAGGFLHGMAGTFGDSEGLHPW